MACGTCHVYIGDKTKSAELDLDEIVLLEEHSAYREDYSRLACQVTVTAALAGQRIEIAPED